MNYLKVIRSITVIIAVIGVFVMIGGAGTSDLMVEMGEYHPLWKTALQMGVGLAMMTPAFFAFRNYELDDDDWEDWDDEIYED
jgi:hypothetical protein